MIESSQLLALVEHDDPEAWPLPLAGSVATAVVLALIALRRGRTTHRLVTVMPALAWLILARDRLSQGRSAGGPVRGWVAGVRAERSPR